ncbi:phenylacetic acid degradation bifunctional protein PaaZ [Pseudonocardia oroxyli]|uniref:3,4-dehydroadipyl-CoA semialdehyde dehydrogenase n=1 Tax=Pseudonocardia oroxyli TaxID=366584 RepID=A0A1G8CYB8_PSEOR|nr:phenylacetic acid degradation bifunctional protein PaaZ [Pseudonocardia oroxyli]SDH50475.1 3,4-dehydroadipyl-CoA semialdehyde dehydrogenase [Pseudonocardia oroxyli]
MGTALESYARGRWTAGADGVPVVDAVTGEEIVSVSSAGLDMAAVAEHAREVGGPALRATTFAQRAALLKALAGALREHRPEFYALSHRTGATLFDSKFDVDGGIGVLSAYAALGARELGDDSVLVVDDPQSLSRAGGFVGQHLAVPRLGAAVQINAYNFPVWGMLEKLAPALLAGVPSIVKPATPTAYLAELVVRKIIESGLLPEGALQLVCGSAGDLLDHLGPQDSVAFTGSAATAERLRATPAVLREAVRFTAEADSLNCSVLGEDVSPGSAEFGLFTDQLVTEMTVKAGQKCTAIRRALVPEHLVDPVLEAVSAALAKVVVGAPTSESVTMGALAGLAQRTDVRAAVEGLTRSASIAFGDPNKVDPVDADPERGAFMAPVLLHAADSEAPEAHSIEAFGPVSTVLGYRDTDHAVALAARGRGSLAASLVTADAELAARMVRGLAPWHGRVLVLDTDSAPESTGHGPPLPGLLHGGPGRAGGGAELGGLESVHHHLQRIAVQGSPAALAAVRGGGR